MPEEKIDILMQSVLSLHNKIDVLDKKIDKLETTIKQIDKNVQDILVYVDITNADSDKHFVRKRKTA